MGRTVVRLTWGRKSCAAGLHLERPLVIIRETSDGPLRRLGGSDAGGTNNQRELLQRHLLHVRQVIQKRVLQRRDTGKRLQMRDQRKLDLRQSLHQRRVSQSEPTWTVDVDH